MSGRSLASQILMMSVPWRNGSPESSRHSILSYNHRLIICTVEQDGNWQVADSSSVKLNLTDPCRTAYSTVPVQLLRDARPAGWVNCFSICASTMPRAQNMTEKGSILKQRRNTLLIWVYNLSMPACQQGELKGTDVNRLKYR